MSPEPEPQIGQSAKSGKTTSKYPTLAERMAADIVASSTEESGTGWNPTTPENEHDLKISDGYQRSNVG